MRNQEIPEIPVTIAGVTYRNPFYVSSGPTTMNVEQLQKIDKYGWGGAELKLTLDPKPYINRHPRYGYYPDKTFLAFTAERRLMLDELLELIEKGRKHASNLVLASNITYSGDKGIEGWVNMAKKCEEAGIHINQLNMCCPNMSFNVELSGDDKGGPKTGASLGQNEKAIVAIVKAIKEETSIPLYVKLTAEGGRQAVVAKAALAAGADAVGTNANRLGIPPIDLDNPTKSMYHLQEEIGMACLNGSWLKPLGLRDVYEMRKMCGPNAVITGTGGVTTWEDAAEMMLCGADLVGMCTATLTRGFGFMPEFLQEFKKYMDKKNYKHPKEMRDIVVPAVTTASDLTIYPGHARKITDRLSAPCTFACPNAVPAQGYVRKVAEEDFEEAYQLIMSRSPLQSICGKICNHPCETECTRGKIDEPVRIREIKRFVLEYAEKQGYKPRLLNNTVKPKADKVAVIGSGPAGLSCAYDLARVGYKVTVYEQNDKLGGMLTSCIPEYRLPEADIQKEINVICDLGVDFITNTTFGKDITVDSLKQDGFKSIFLGLGAQQGAKLKCPGEDLKNSFDALEYLMGVRKDKSFHNGKKVAVIGGGFTAVDSARTAIRLGADEVYLLYRRTRDEMPASTEEIEDAEEEGVKIMYLVTPKEIIGNGKVEKIKLINDVLGEPDESGRRRPEEVKKTEFVLDVDTVIAAVSQNVVLPEKGCPGASSYNIIEVDEKYGKTDIDGVFAGGDCSRGPENAITAIADGKRAAASIDQYISGEAAILDHDPEKTSVDKEKILEREGNRRRQPRQKIHKTPAEERKHSFEEYTKTFTEEEAVAEASRCLSCGCGAGCEICKDICKMGAWDINEDGIAVLDTDKCVGCGMCVYLCPNNNIEMEQTGNENLID
jgi:NADPH-dependent glutamate synthase beta subunit-like oxidoreductase/dihydroorotate dehydrogenase